LTGRDSHKIKTIEGYAKENKLWRNDKTDAVYSGQVMDLDLGSV
jgi:aconitase A